MTDARLAPYGAFILRLNLGGVLLAHGLYKAIFAGLSGTVALMERAGFFGWTAYPVIFGEVVGGVALILGIAPRLAALAALPIILGATSVHLGNGWFFGAAGGGGWEYPVFLFFTLLVQSLIGDGAFTLFGSDRVRFRLGRGCVQDVSSAS